MLWTKSPEVDAERHYVKMEKFTNTIPKCLVCGELIDPYYEEGAWDDGEGIKCFKCFKEQYFVPMEDLIGYDE